MRYFINGMFLQQGDGVGTRIIPGDGVIAVFETRNRGYIFNGVIQRLAGSNHWRGWVIDHFGYAELSNIVVGDGVLCFTKMYESRTDEIHYAFRKHAEAEAVLVGNYEGVDTGKNASWCMLTEVSDRMFDEHVIRNLAAEQPALPVVTLSADAVDRWNLYRRASGLLPAGETPRVNSTVLVHDTEGKYLTTAYLTEHEMVGGTPDGRTRVTVSAKVRTSFN